jgi:hypothetical protein
MDFGTKTYLPSLLLSKVFKVKTGETVLSSGFRKVYDVSAILIILVDELVNCKRAVSPQRSEQRMAEL